jgi:AcrR family transcriptional regulator
MAHPQPPSEASRRPRPGGRSARVRAAVLQATLELLAERGYEGAEVPEVARRAGVHPTTVYRRWGTKSRLVGEALLERSRPLSPTPDTGSLRTDLERLLLEGAGLVRTPAVRALFEVLLAGSADPSTEVAAARDRFWAAHLEEARGIVARAVARSELPARTDPAALVDLVIGPALLHLVLMGQHLEPEDMSRIVDRAIAALRAGGNWRPVTAASQV